MKKPSHQQRLRGTTSELVDAAKMLLRRQTPAEERLWDAVRGKRELPHRVRRQHAYGPYVLDFWIPEVRVAIEVDGTIHDDHEIAAYDRERTAWFEAQDIVLIRFRNEEVFEDIEYVLDRIRSVVQITKR